MSGRWRLWLASVLGMVVVAAGLLAFEGRTATRPWEDGYLPNPLLTTQHGERIRFHDLIRGRAVAVNTFFTVCTDVCPLGTAKLLELQRQLGERVGRDIVFLSISVDPAHDTPAAMHAYAAQYGAGPGWYFLTGQEAEVAQLVRRLGLGSIGPTSPRDAHTSTLRVGHEPSGQWMKTSSTDNPLYVAETVRTFLGWPRTDAAPDYRQARALQITSGEYLFRNGCAACHSIGEGDRLGPDLRDVGQRRDRAWLERFVSAPDAMLDAGDPVAQALLARYKGVRMPNLGLAPDEVREILGYIEARSARLGGRAHAGGH